MAKTIEEIYREVKEKYHRENKFDNGIVYEILPPRTMADSAETEKSREQKIAEKNLAFQERIRGISNLPSVSNMNNKPTPILSPSSSSPNLLQEKLVEKEKRYCPYCYFDVDSDEKFCPKCNLPVPEKNYKSSVDFSGLSLGLNVDNILHNIEGGAEPPEPVEIKTSRGNSLIIKPVMTDEDFVRYYPSYENRISAYCELKKFTVIDFETANMYPDSVCQIGIVVVEGDKITEKKSYLIRPPYNDFRNSDIHGINFDDVKNENTFAELWEEIKPFIENKLVGAYNAQFDIGCLLATLENFKIEMPDFAYFDILQNVKNSFQDLRSYKLKSVARKLKIKYTPHDALSDALAAVYLQLKCNMTATFSFMYAKNNNHFEVMTGLFTDKDILSFARKELKEITSSNFASYAKVIDMLNLVEERGADKAKILKLRGEIFEKCGMNDDALNSYRNAYELNEKIGVKGKIQKLEKELRGKK